MGRRGNTDRRRGLRSVEEFVGDAKTVEALGTETLCRFLSSCTAVERFTVFYRLTRVASSGITVPSEMAPSPHIHTPPALRARVEVWGP